MDAARNPRAPTCACGSERVCISYIAPVFAHVEGGVVSRVVVADEEVLFGGVVRCLACDRSWVLDEEPDLGDWPAWELGF